MESRVRAPLAALALFAILLPPGGCASLLPPGTGDARSAMALYFPASGGGSLRGEGEVTMSAAGRKVSLPAVFQLGGPAQFRFDLLDPLDRPAAVLFPSGGRIIHYQPMAGTASAILPIPRRCGSAGPASWVNHLLGVSPEKGEKGGWQLQSRAGGTALARYEGAALREEILIGEAGGAVVPVGATWYCEGEPVLKLRKVSYTAGKGRRVPASFEVLFPKGGLKMVVAVAGAEAIPEGTGALPSPELPAGLRWTAWDPFGGE